MNYIAHIRMLDKEEQTVENHLLAVKKIAEKAGEKIGVKHLAGLAGLLHDMGKYTDEFKEYITQAVYEPDNPPKRGSVDHSTAGGKLLYDLYHQNPSKIYKVCLAEIVGNVIISHHSYLKDYLNEKLESDYLNRVKHKPLPNYEMTKKQFFSKVMIESDFSAYVGSAENELKKYIIDNPGDTKTKLMFLTKYIFSALIDGDWTNSREFEENIYSDTIENRSSVFKRYYNQLMKKIKGFESGPKTPINTLRAQMSKQCEEMAEAPSGVFTLSIPTGGGKTLASLRYGLKHTIKHRKERIIYVVPYTTIIEQNADVVRDILKDDENIIEHHSNVVEENDSITQQKTKLLKDNWSAPIIFTTMVQYLNVFYADGRRNVRRLHNLSNAVIIFDEVQKVPTNCISLFNESLNFLNKQANSSVVLCTATQPALDFVNRKLEIEEDAEIIKDIDQVVDKFKRVEIIDKATNITFDQEKLVEFINDQLSKVENILVILNTKQVVKNLYEVLKEKYDDIYIYHLSTSMCPNHRTAILDEVKKCLRENKRVICVSTQLIEAGVDISFDCVIRSLAGLDSIAQAAGRCNRHGNNTLQHVYVIDYMEENLKHLKEIRKGKDIVKNILQDLQRDETIYGDDLLSVQAMNYYFKRFYNESKTVLDYPIDKSNLNLIELLMAEDNDNSLYKSYYLNNKSQLPLLLKNSYGTAAKHFKVIDSPTTSILVPYGGGKDIIAELNGEVPIDDITKIFQKAQRYSINVYAYQIDVLNEKNSLTTVFDDQVYALKESAYDDEYGLNLDADSALPMYGF